MLTFSTTTPAPAAFIIHLQGPLNALTYQALESELDRLIGEEGAKLVVLDTKHLEFLSSVGIRVLVKALKNLQANGGDLRVMQVPAVIQAVFDIIALFPAGESFATSADLDRHLATRK